MASPDYFQWVLGWRNFNALSNGYVGALAFSDYIWNPGENQATCAVGLDGIIHSDHHCGFNAYYEHHCTKLSHLHVALIRGRGDRFAIHPEGFRSEVAEILAFVGPADSLREAQAARYNVPFFEKPEEALKWALQEELGDTFPEDRRPPSGEEGSAVIFGGGNPILNTAAAVALAKKKNTLIQDMTRMFEDAVDEAPHIDEEFSTRYMIFMGLLALSLIAGFIIGIVQVGGVFVG